MMLEMTIVPRIQIELVPIEYMSPGPPTNPNPLMVLEKIANAVTNVPSLRPATKKSCADVVRRRDQSPMATQSTRYAMTASSVIRARFASTDR